jgi:protein XagA
MKQLHFIFTVGFILIFQQSFSQWTNGKGKAYYKLAAWSLVADQHYTNSGQIDPNATRGNFTMSLYGEYGLTDKLDIISYVPFFTRIYQNAQVSGITGNVLQEGESLNAFGDLDIGVRYLLYKKKNLSFSTTLKFGLPTGKNSGGSDGSYQTGDGEFNQLLTVDAGISYQLFQKPSYAKTFIGFNNRTQGFSDEFQYGFETGIKLFDKLWILGRLHSVNSLQNGTLTAQNTQGSIFANNIEYVAVGGEAAYYISKKLGITLNYTSAISGRIIYANPSISGGIFLDLK